MDVSVLTLTNNQYGIMLNVSRKGTKYVLYVYEYIKHNVRDSFS